MLAVKVAKWCRPSLYGSSMPFRIRPLEQFGAEPDTAPTGEFYQIQDCGMGAGFTGDSIASMIASANSDVLAWPLTSRVSLA